MPLAEMPQDLALILVTGSGAIWPGPMDRSKDKLRKGKPAAYCPWLPEFSGSRGGDSPNFQTRSPSCLFSGAFLWIQIIPNTPANPGPAPKTSIPECLGLGWGLGLGLGVGVRVGPRLGSVAGLEMEVEQQTMGQGWLKHRSKARRAGPEAELVTEEARSHMSWREGTLEPYPQPPVPPHPSRHTPSSRECCVPGGPVAIEDCRSCVVPKLWLDLLRKGGLSSEALGEPWSWGWESQRSRGEQELVERRNAEQRQEEGYSRKRGGMFGQTYHGHKASLPPGCWGRSRARRQEVDTARELGDNRETRRETDTGEEREKDTVRGDLRSWVLTVTDRAKGPALIILPCTPSPFLQVSSRQLLKAEVACRKYPLSRRPTTTTPAGCSCP